MPVAEKARKEAEHQSLRQNYKQRRNKTNASVKWKTAALIRRAEKWNQTARWKGGWKWRKKDQRERGMDCFFSPSLPPDRNQYMVTNCPWQRALWRRLKTRNPCTQYNPHNDANRRSRSTHIKKNQVVSISEAPRRYSHHRHIDKERNNRRNKKESKERKN